MLSYGVTTWIGLYGWQFRLRVIVPQRREMLLIVSITRLSDPVSIIYRPSWYSCTVAEYGVKQQANIHSRTYYILRNCQGPPPPPPFSTPSPTPPTHEPWLTWAVQNQFPPHVDVITAVAKRLWHKVKVGVVGGQKDGDVLSHEEVRQFPFFYCTSDLQQEQ